MRSLRVIDTGVRPARWNIAVTAALADLRRLRSIPDTLRFHRYPRSVLLGRHQAADQEIHAERCRQRGVEIARRVTGGGAVYMSPTVLAWDLVVDRAPLGRQLDEASRRICSIVAAGLSRLGLAARFNPPNDILIDGRKVSGSSGGFDGVALIHQGTVVLNVDRDEMAEVLRARQGQTAPAARVASLAEFLGRVPSAAEVQDVLVAAMSDAWRMVERREELGREEIALTEALLAQEIGTDEFVMGPAIAVAGPAVRSAGRARL